MITFNILYIPGTVTSLRLFPKTLVRWSQSAPAHDVTQPSKGTDLAEDREFSVSACRFRLVANGCLEEERRILQKLCAGEPRFEYLELSKTEMLTHGVALSRLQRMEESEYFAYLDSDVYAVGPWFGSVRRELLRRDAVFSCPPVWSDAQFETLPRGYRVLGGAFLHLEDGRCLGNSYFGIYDNRKLKESIERYGVAFERRDWKEVPAPLQGLLEAEGLPMKILDTGRLLNLLLGFDGRDLAFLPLEGLGHIGGVSGLRAMDVRPTASRIRRRLNHGLQAVRRRVKKQSEDSLAEKERALNRRKSRCRRATVSYFTGLLEALSQGRPHEGEAALRALAVDEPALVERIRGAEAQIVALHEAEAGPA